MTVYPSTQSGKLILGKPDKNIYIKITSNAFMKYFEAISVSSFILGGISLIVFNIYFSTSAGFVDIYSDNGVTVFFFIVAIVFGTIGLIDRRLSGSSRSD